MDTLVSDYIVNWNLYNAYTGIAFAVLALVFFVCLATFDVVQWAVRKIRN